MTDQNYKDFDIAVSKLRNFFKSKGFIEVHTQNKLSILAACEDPTTMSTYNYSGNVGAEPKLSQNSLK